MRRSRTLPDSRGSGCSAASSSPPATKSPAAAAGASPASHAATAESPRRNRRKVEIGVVASDKMNKTRRVEVELLVPHPKYGKFVRSRTVCYMHDEENATHVGDLVEMMETRPLSKQKRWRLVRIVRKGGQLALGGEGEAAATGQDSPAEG